MMPSVQTPCVKIAGKLATWGVRPCFQQGLTAEAVREGHVDSDWRGARPCMPGIRSSRYLPQFWDDCNDLRLVTPDTGPKMPADYKETLRGQNLGIRRAASALRPIVAINQLQKLSTLK